MTDASSDRARWAAAFADELAGFEPGPYVEGDSEAPKPLSPATRLVKARKTAAARAQRARDKARRAHELDAAIVAGLRSTLRQRKVYERLRDGEAMAQVAMRLEPILGEAMTALVEDYGWERPHAAGALNRKLLRPAQPPAAKA